MLYLQPVYGFSSSNKDAARFLRAAGHSDLWFVEDREAPFQQVGDGFDIKIVVYISP